MQLIERLSRRLSRTLLFKRAVEEIVSQDRAGVSARFIPLPRRDNVLFVSSSEPNNHLPLPPHHLWEGYAETEAEYLKCGQDDVAQMLGILNEVEQRPVALGRVLDLGCASGRMLRFLPREETSEHWGVDINAAHIEWCQQNLNPPMLFATNTTSNGAGSSKPSD